MKNNIYIIQAKELQAKMAAKQSWPRPEVLPETSEIELSLPSQSSTYKKVSFKDKSKRLVRNQKPEELSLKENKLKNKVIDNEDKIESTSKVRVDSDIQQIEKEVNYDNRDNRESIDQENPQIDEIKGLNFLKDVAESDEDGKMRKIILCLFYDAY